MITIDSREKKISHILKAFDNMRIPYQMKKLDYGDYQNSDNQTVIIDRKQNLDEIAKNLCSKDDRRFWNEIRGAHKAGIKMIILCEHGHGVKSIQDAAKWKSAYSKVNGSWLINQMFNVSMAYGVEWRFCDRAATPKEILKALECNR